MSDRPFTVFFDTYFYVWLAKASDIEASEVISKLNELKVRHVLSTQVLVELLTNAVSPDKDRSLFQRITKLDIPPFKILRTTSVTTLESDSLSWDALLIDGAARDSLSSLFKSIHDAETLAESFSITAGRKLNNTQQEKLYESISPFTESIGLNKIKEGQKPPEEFLGFINQLFSNISHVLSDEQREIFEQIDFTRESPDKIADRLNKMINPEDLKWLKEGGTILESATKSDDRPFKVATQQASTKEIKRLGNTIRDSAHMLSFEKYENEIDILQLDAAQINLINAKGQNPHRFVEIGLANRCFCSNNLKSTLEFLEKRKTEFPS